MSVVAYHAGMEDAERVRAQDDFMSGRVQMIVATNAFGMGIDKPDIRFVTHYHLPGSIEAYYQEIGRAGRDGLSSTCMLLFNYADKRTQDYFIEGSYPPPELIAKVYEALVGTGQKRIELSTREIAARSGVRNEMAVQSALITLEKAGHIERGAAGENRASVRLAVPAQEAREAVNARRSAQMKQVLFGLLGGYEVNQRTETELDVVDLAETLGMELSSLRRTFAALVEAGIITYQTARRTRGVVMLDAQPVRNLRIRPQELARRAALEQRKLREMISFCYVESCYRAFILDYFGDSAHAATCGKCGNCMAAAQNREARAEVAHVLTSTGRTRAASSVPLAPATEFDKFVMKHVPFAGDLEEELSEQKRLRRGRERAEASGKDLEAETIGVTEARDLTEAEALTARKILACAARMGGRFGKGLLAATLRGSRSAKITQAGLEQLSTYGILSNMTQEEIMLYIDALVSARCLTIETGTYPTIALSPLGGEVMRQRTNVQLALPPPDRFDASRASFSTSNARAASGNSSVSLRRGADTSVPKVTTVEETYALYSEGLSIEEICARRGLTEMTVEKHLADCILAGRPFDISQHVDEETRALIELAVEQLGTERLKPLRDALAQHITYRMIRFVVADMQRGQENES